MNLLQSILAVCTLALVSLAATAADQTPPQKMTAPKPLLSPKPVQLAPIAPKTQTTSPTPKRSGPPYNVIVPAAFVVTGTGALEARMAFAAKTLTTSEFTVTGTGALAARAEFAPKTFTAPAFAVTGTDSLR
jgi:hypothetical protein